MQGGLPGLQANQFIMPDGSGEYRVALVERGEENVSPVTLATTPWSTDAEPAHRQRRSSRRELIEPESVGTLGRGQERTEQVATVAVPLSAAMSVESDDITFCARILRPRVADDDDRT